MKEKIAIFGLGMDFQKYKSELEKVYEIAAYSDNFGLCQDPEVREKYVAANQIKEIQFDKLVICTSQYYEAIKYQLEHAYHIPRKLIYNVNKLGLADETVNKNYERTVETLEQYRRRNNRSEFAVSEKDLHFICDDYDKEAGRTQQHYFAQDIWGAKKIWKANPKEHYDIGSRLDGFIAHLLVFRDTVNYIDIRPLPNEIEGLHFIQGDASDLTTIEDASIESLSSFHAVEHFGLGRYGDPIDPEACFKALHNFARIISKQGHLYLGVPIGPRNKVVFNAHRIFTVKTIIEELKELKLIDFALITPQEQNYKKILLTEIDKLNEEVTDYSCGLFEFVKE